MTTSKIGGSSKDVQNSICEAIQSNPVDSFENDALKRCAAISQGSEGSENEVQQLYDRMYHQHNRG